MASPPSSSNGRRQNRQSGLPRLDTENKQSNRFSWVKTTAPGQSQEAQSNRFSWMKTPAQEHPATFDTPQHSRPETIIDDSPSTTFEMEAPYAQQPAAAYSTPSQPSYQMEAPLPQQPATAYTATPQVSYQMPTQSPPSHERKTSYTAHNPASSTSSHNEHPGLRAPYADPQPQYGYQHYQQTPPHITSPVSTVSHSSYGHPQPHQPYSQPGPTSPNTKKEPYGSSYTKPNPPPIPLDFHSPYAPTTPRSNSIPAYTPASPMGPNASTFHLDHQPTQPSHPGHSSTSNAKWHSSTLAPSTSCLTSLFCPCIVYGRVQYRLAQRSKKSEPTDLLGHSMFNGQCGIMALACGFQGLLATIQRTRVRRAYGIEGDFCGDCLRGCCCCCCAIGLSESEIVTREEERKTVTGTGYVSTGRLTYMPPPR